MNREVLLEPVVASIRQGLHLAKQDILKSLEDWDVIPVQADGQHAATVVAKGTEIHIAVVEGYKPKSSQRGVIRGFLKPLFDQHEFLTTRVPHHRLAQKKFVQRVGFKPTWKDENFEYYMLTSMPFERKNNA
jgi:hypothetical protein